MLTRHLLRLGLLLVLLPRPAIATMVDAPDIDSLISQSDYIVRAVVKAATPEWREHAGRRYISTKVELEIREVIKGAPPARLVLDLIGGRIGEEELVVEGLPRFGVGDDQILFVHGEQRKMFPLVALMHGVYPVFRDAKTGQDYVMRSNGRPLYSAQDVSLPMTTPTAAQQQNSAARPMTAATFARQIRNRIAAQSPAQREK
ncbi:MAG: hypothetical protein HYX71_02380 [Opitutae bacterium]|nr:hypothetical protein [Opitutae bacterium]